MNDEDEISPELRKLLAAAWESGYWAGTSHTGPLNDAAVSARNPYREAA
jgi:hypothetical protein